MRFRDEFFEANGDLMVAVARCLICGRPRTAARGDAFAVEVECRECEVADEPREVGCPACNRRLFDLKGCGPRVEVTVRCDKCDTLVSVRRPSSHVTFVSVKRPMTGQIALRFGIRPTPFRPAMPASAGPLKSCAT